MQAKPTVQREDLRGTLTPRVQLMIGLIPLDKSTDEISDQYHEYLEKKHVTG